MCVCISECVCVWRDIAFDCSLTLTAGCLFGCLAGWLDEWLALPLPWLAGLFVRRSACWMADDDDGLVWLFRLLALPTTTTTTTTAH